MLYLDLLFFLLLNSAPSLSAAREGRRACRHAPCEWHLQPRLCLGRLNNDGHSAASGHDWPMLMPRINGYLLFVRVIKGMQPVTGRTDSHWLQSDIVFARFVACQFFAVEHYLLCLSNDIFPLLLLLLLLLLLQPTNPPTRWLSALWPKSC